MEQVLITVVVLLFSVVVHECAHGWVALQLGDRTALDAGRLTLNPVRHIDPFGSVILPLLLSISGGVLFAWAKPVPVRVDRLHDPENDYPKVAAAGPAANLLLALISAVGLGATVAVGSRLPGTADGLLTFLVLVFQTAIMANVFLALFNLLPLPPLDGSWIFSRLLHGEARRNYEGLRRYGFLLVIGFLVLMHYTFVGDLVRHGFLLALGPFMSIARAIAGLGL